MSSLLPLPLMLFFLLTTFPLPLLTNAASDSDYCPSDPYADPQTDVCNPLRYIPTLSVTCVALALYFLTAVLLTWQFFKHGGKWFLCLVIGAYCEGIGLVMRIPFRSNPHNSGIYIVEYLFVVLSPCAFLAADYILLGRLTAHLNGDTHIRPFKPRTLMRVFVGSDVFTFLIQAAGGGLSTAHNAKLGDIGGRVFLAGIALQCASFLFFTGLYATFGWRCRKSDPVVWNTPGWKPLYWCLGWTCIMFLIRSIYRTIELSQGYLGYLNTHEPWFLAFDTLPLWLGVTAYVYFWPTKYLTEATRVHRPEEETEKEEPSSYVGLTSDAMLEPRSGLDDTASVGRGRAGMENIPLGQVSSTKSLTAWA